MLLFMEGPHQIFPHQPTPTVGEARFCRLQNPDCSMFSAWMHGTKVIEINIPTKEVADHFDELYQLKEVPKALQVSIPCMHIYHS
jgi:hypothetical protein